MSKNGINTPDSIEKCSSVLSAISILPIDAVAQSQDEILIADMGDASTISAQRQENLKNRNVRNFSMDQRIALLPTLSSLAV